MGIATYNYNRTTSGGEIITHLINASDSAGLHFADGGYIDLLNAAGAEFGTSDFTIEFILNQDGDNASDNWLYLTQISGNNRVYFYNDISANVIKIYFVNNSGAATLSTLAYDMSADYGTPTHYAFTFDRSGNVELYKNANSVATDDISGSSAIDLGSGNITVGRIGDPTAGYTVLGTFYRFRTWNKSLSQAEVTASFENATVNFSDQYGSQTSLVDAAASVFTSGTYSWVKYGSNTIANVSNALAITYADNGFGAYNYLKDASDLNKNLVVGKKYRLTVDAKYTGGSAGVRLNVYDGVSVQIYSAALTESLVTYNIEFTAQHASAGYFRLDSMAASNVVTIDNWYVREIGCVADYDLAFANPTQSNQVQDRAGAADGTASASGVSQITKLEQVNTNKLSVGGTTPLVGIGLAAGVTPKAALHVQSTSGPVTESTRDSGSGNTGASGALYLRNKTTAAMINGFGPEMQFRITDDANPDVALAAINATRQTDDTSGQLVFRTYKTGSGVDRMTIDEDGNVGIGGTPDVNLLINAASGECAVKLESGGSAQASSIYLNDEGSPAWKISKLGTSQSLDFQYNTSSKLTISSAGLATFSAGIAFSSQTDAAGMTETTLNHYEEGIWTPTFSTGAAGYTTQTGTYTRIGRVVEVEATIRTTTLTGSGNVTIAGLPFDIAKRNPVSIWADSWGTAPLYADAIVGTATVALYSSKGTNGNGVATTAADMLSGFNITTINFTYQV